MLARLFGVKGKAKDLHTGIAGGITQIVDLLGHHTQVLGDHCHTGQLGLHCVHKVHIRTFQPLAATGGLIAKGNCPVSLKATEMVQSHHIIPLACGSHTLDPPGEILFLVHIPAVQGITPQLTILAEIIRGTACYSFRIQILVQQEHSRIGPHLYRVIRHIDGHIANDLDTLAVGIVPKGLPLGIEQILQEAVEVHFVLQLCAIFLQRSRLTEFDGILPLIPGHTPELLLQRHKQRKVRQPCLLLAAEGAELLGLLKAVECLAQHAETALIQQAKVHPLLGDRPAAAFHLLLLKQSLLDQLIQVDQVVVACKGGAGLVGRITVAGGSQRKDLPVALTSLLQKVHEAVGFLSHRAHAVGAGQRSNMHQNTTVTHSIFS